MMNTPIRICQLHSISGTSQAACRDSPPIIKPRKPLPASPMKIRAGGKFHTRKPATEAHSSSGSAISPVSPSRV